MKSEFTLYLVVELRDDIKHVVRQIRIGFFNHFFGNFIVGFGNGTTYSSLRISVSTGSNCLADGVFKVLTFKETTDGIGYGFIA